VSNDDHILHLSIEKDEHISPQIEEVSDQSDDEEVIEILESDENDEEQGESDGSDGLKSLDLFNIRSMILKEQKQSSPETEPMQLLEKSTAKTANFTESSTFKLLEKLEGKSISVTVNKTDQNNDSPGDRNSDLEKVLAECEESETRQETLSEVASPGQKLKMTPERSWLRGSQTGPAVYFHCPFAGCSFKNKRVVDFHVHLGTKHYRARVEEEFPDFANKTCVRCENKTFNVKSNYYSHMSKHLDLPYMTKNALKPLARSEQPAGPPGPSAAASPALSPIRSSNIKKEGENNGQDRRVFFQAFRERFSPDRSVDHEIVEISSTKRKPSIAMENAKEKKSKTSLASQPLHM